MSASAPPREPEYTIKGGTAVVENIVFKDSTGTAYAPSTSQTCFRVDMRNGNAVAVTLTAVGTPSQGYTLNDTPPYSTSEDIVYVYEWKGLDGTKPPITGDRVVRVTRSWGV